LFDKLKACVKVTGKFAMLHRRGSAKHAHPQHCLGLAKIVAIAEIDIAATKKRKANDFATCAW
jgi:hypothetical protein